MSFAHLTLATRDVERTASFLEHTLGYPRAPLPDNIPFESVWLDLGRGQQMHLVHVDGFEVSAFENEFGRHVALFHPTDDFDALKQRLADHGATVSGPLRPTSYARIFFQDPVNGYVFEIIAQGDTERVKG